MNTSRRSLVAVIAGVLLLLALAAPVLAHAELKASDPEDKAVIATPPAKVTLTFTEGLDQAKSSFKLNGPSGTVGTAKPARQGDKVMTLDGLSLGPGAYSIQWTAGAADGHVERGKLSFTVLEPTPAPPTPVPSTPSPIPATTRAPSASPSSVVQPTALATAASTATATATPVDLETGSSSSGATGSDIVIALVGGLAAVAVGGAFVMRRSRRA
ncbi:MAG TPA: copper resistance CopC family protein [Candidatus Limnocylindrales bacterium]|nr:copper resistance CopC family protein [Candidatus Limnocylindrales bacterium]